MGPFYLIWVTETQFLFSLKFKKMKASLKVLEVQDRKV